MDTRDDNPAPKKRVRTISNLSDEQVRKKRENDREAQRAFRERTKNRIQILEDELSELRSERELHGAGSIQELKALRDENAALRDQIRRISEIVSPGASSSDQEGGTEDSCIVVSNGNSARNQVQTSGAQTDAVDLETPGSQGNDSDNGLTSYDLNSPTTPQQGQNNDGANLQRSVYDPISNQVSQQRPANYDGIHLSQRNHHHNHHIDNTFDHGLDHQIRAPEYLQSPPPSISCSSEQHLAQDRTLNQIVEHQTDHNLRHGRTSSADLSNYDLENRGHSTFESARSGPMETSAWEPRRNESDGYLDGGMASNSLHGSSVSPNAVSSPPTAIIPASWVTPDTIEPISMSNILPQHLAATCPLDQILLDFLASRRLLAAQGTPVAVLVGPLSPSISGLLNPKRKANAHAASRVMVDVALTFKDTNLREQLGFLYIMYATMRDFSELYARCARLDWPFEPAEAVMPKPDDSGELVMNPLFEKRARTLECWSVGEMFKTKFPELAAAMVC
ncbi:hypothetical protein ACEPPN_003197 [Leptodophora sp. 'Broadleaf-Isolate-01']